MSREIGRGAESPAPARLAAAPERLDGPTRLLALAAAFVCAWLYLGRLDRLLLQRGNEAMYATPSIHMLSSGDYLMPRWQHQDFLDKPPLTFWIVAASYRLFGINCSRKTCPPRWRDWRRRRSWGSGCAGAPADVQGCSQA